MNDIIHAGKHFLTFNVHRHKHSAWELIYCTEKSGKFVFDDLQIPYSAGDIVVIPPETPHKNLSENGFTNIHLNISSSTLSFQQPVLIRDDSNKTILHLFSDAYYIYCSDIKTKADLLSSYGNLIVQFMAVHLSSNQKNKIAERIERSIMLNYADANYKLDEVLREMPYCEDYLCRVFRKETGVTPHKYLTNLRLQSAAAKLSSVYNNGNITEVAHLCGFRNPLYFSRLFKARYGVSPKEYYRLQLVDQKRKEQELESERGSRKIILPQ